MVAPCVYRRGSAPPERRASNPVAPDAAEAPALLYGSGSTLRERDAAGSTVRDGADACTEAKNRGAKIGGMTRSRCFRVTCALLFSGVTGLASAGQTATISAEDIAALKAELTRLRDDVAQLRA